MSGICHLLFLVLCAQTHFGAVPLSAHKHKRIFTLCFGNKIWGKTEIELT